MYRIGLHLVVCCLLANLSLAQEGRGTRRRSTSEEPKRVPISLDGGASINPQILAGIKDDTIGVMPEDREAYFRILKLTEKLDPVELRELAHDYRKERRDSHAKYRRRPVEKFPTFVDLFQHPAEYRGRPVTLHGYFRRLVAFDPGKNDQGFPVLYEGWFYPDEGQGNPTVIVFSRKPEGLPTGGDISEEATVTGYFLKMYGYQAQDTARKAPLILAQTVRWRPQPELVRWAPSPALYVAISLGVLVMSVLIWLGMREAHLQHRRDKEARDAKYDHFIAPDAEDSTASQSSAPSLNGFSLEPHH